MTKPVCVLVGAPGAGKSTVGALVAERLGRAYADSDDLIVERAGKPISDIFIDDGEPAFRALEAETIATALSGFDGVLALGGGAILDPATRALLKDQDVVYLTVELGEAIKRIGLNQSRPLLAVNPRATLRHLLAQRTPLYEEVATHTIATDDLDADRVADVVVAALEL
ncbi:MAG TPA: shikimate kinase [Micromonosporaceae bacterium]